MSDLHAPLRYGYVRVQGWHGTTETRVLIVGETPKRYRIQAINTLKLGGRNRWLDAGCTAFVPKRAVREGRL